MRKLVVLILFLSAFRLHAQSDITALEYFIDSDPGVGLATSIPITSGSEIDINYTIPVSGLGLSPGFHLLIVRAQNADGNWSFYEKRSFYIQNTPPVVGTTPDIDKLEYFIDADPGVSQGTQVSITVGQTFDINQTLSSASLSDGFHVICYRAGYTNGKWGFYEKRAVYIVPEVIDNSIVPDITELEYFFDEDPGPGNANPLSVAPAEVIDINQLIPNSLITGWHIIGIRAKNADGAWGFAEKRAVYVNPQSTVNPPPSPIVKLEYFYNDDPGEGLRQEVLIDPATTDVDIQSLLLPTEESIPVGTNSITLRAQNNDGFFGFSETREFDVVDDCAQPTAAFSVELACEGEVVNFIDESLNTQLDAEYRWYFDGDDTPDDFTSGSTSFVFDNPGDYEVSLAISQGQICYDSISTVITIKEKPIVVFNTDRVTEVETTTYTVDQFNVEAGAIWEWDFQSDGIIDDNTVGNTTHSFGAEGTFLTTLTVRDGNGCGTSYSKSVNVDAEEDGTTGPRANFSAPNTCTGEIKNYSDLSTNIPAGSTYSWDFDGDGIEDDNTVGNTQFVFTSSGVFTSQLIIDTGTEIISHSEIVEVLDFPAADFEATQTCFGNATSFTDLSTSVEPGATYEWDFDNDGVVDSNTVGDESFTYSSAGSYAAVLIINNGSGCFDTRVQTVVVSDQPTADYIAQPACVGSSTQFLDNSTNVSSSATYSWDFNNDGTIDSNSENPSFVYDNPGSYDVTLTVDNGAGCSDIILKTIDISAAPAIDFSFSSACVGTSVSFNDLSSGVATDAVYSWDFDGDGQEDSNLKTGVTHVYNTSGSYNTILTIDQGNGCSVSQSQIVSVIPEPVADFSFENTCDGDQTNFVNLSSDLTPSASFQWDFNDDGITDSNAANPQNEFGGAGNYSVTLTVDNGSGCISTVNKTVTILPIPIPDFTYNSGCVGEEVFFTDNSTSLSANATYSWDFNGDGILDSNIAGDVSFTYAGDGPYFAELQIDNGSGCISSTIVEVAFNNSPSTDFTTSPVCLGEETVFTDLSTNILNSSTYTWDFDGDGNIDSNVPGSTSFSFTTSGTYTATLTINNNGCQTSIEKEVIVYDLPQIELGSDQVICENQSIVLDPGSGFVNYNWSNGSNNQSIEVTQADTYGVEVTDANGCVASDEIIISTGGLPVPEFSTQVELLDFSAIVQFINESQEADSYSWDFGDGATSDQRSPSHQYNDVDVFNGSIYEVCLTTSNSCGTEVHCELVPLLVTDFQDDLSSEGFKVFPNPNDGKFQIEIDKNLSINLIWLFNGKGQLIKVLNTEGKNLLSVENLRSGTYFIKAESEGDFYGQKIIVN